MRRAGLTALMIAATALVIACGGGNERPTPTAPGPGGGKAPAPRRKGAEPTGKAADPVPEPPSPAAAWLADLDRRQREETAAVEKEWRDQIGAARIEFATHQTDYALSVALGSLHIHQLAARTRAVEAGRRLYILQQSPPKTPDRKLYADRLDTIRGGEFGYVHRDAGEVLQVVGPDEVLLNLQSGELVWFAGISGAVDKSVIVISGVVEGTGPRSYTSVMGANRTVRSFRRHDGQLPWRPVITAQLPDLAAPPPLPQPKAAPKKK